MSKTKTAIVIGAGLGGLATAAYLAKDGFEVTVLEKNNFVGGRAQVWQNQGFTFDMGPSFYWMPENFENFFADFGHSSTDFFDLRRLDPSYKVYFDNDNISLPASRKGVKEVFEKREKGSGEKLEKMLNKTAKAYKISNDNFIINSFFPLHRLIRPKYAIAGIKLMLNYNGLQSAKRFIKKSFENSKLIKLLEFPLFFLGAKSKDLPAVYSLMNHVDYDLGTWYPIGGIGKLVEAFGNIAKENGVKIILDQEVEKIETEKSKIAKLKTAKKEYSADVIVSNADYEFTERIIDQQSKKQYSQKYWNSRKIAPSSLLFYVGLDKKLEGFEHHTLFFTGNWDDHLESTFGKNQKWPKKALYYTSCPTKTDPTIAPKGKELLTILVPLSPNIEDAEEERQKSWDMIMKDMERTTNQDIEKHVLFKRSYAHKDFIKDYNAYKGNAYGLGQTLFQTAIFRPRNHSKKLKNLYYVGQFTVPGIGIPMVPLSAKTVSQDIIKKYAK